MKKKKNLKNNLFGITPVSFTPKKLKPISFVAKPRKPKMTNLIFGYDHPKPARKVKGKLSMTWPQAKKKFPKMNPLGDRDCDGVQNFLDCRPFDKKRQSSINKKLKAKEREIMKRYAEYAEKFKAKEKEIMKFAHSKKMFKEHFKNIKEKRKKGFPKMSAQQQIDAVARGDKPVASVDLALYDEGKYKSRGLNVKRIPSKKTDAHFGEVILYRPETKAHAEVLEKDYKTVKRATPKGAIKQGAVYGYQPDEIKDFVERRFKINIPKEEVEKEVVKVKMDLNNGKLEPFETVSPVKWKKKASIPYVDYPEQYSEESEDVELRGRPKKFEYDEWEVEEKTDAQELLDEVEKEEEPEVELDKEDEEKDK